MTERTLMIQTRLDYEDDAVSITSSHSEQYDSDQEFLVERVLAEKKGEDGNMYFLISWADYPEEKSTWEPKENIQDPEILRTWKKRKDQEDRGLKPKFSIARFNARLEDFARAKEARRRRRKNKRRRLGIPVSPETEQRADDSDSSEAVGSDGALEDYQEVRRKAKAAQKAKKPDIEPLLRRRGSIHRDSYESDGASRSDDPVRGETQAKAVKKAKKQALEAVRDKKAAQASSKVGRGKEEPGPKKAVEKSASTRPVSLSSSDLPIAGLTKQRQLAQQQQRSESTDSVISRQLASTIKGSSRPAPITSPATASTRGDPANRGGSAGRGKGATRGGAIVGPKNVFISRGTVKKRRSIIESSTDASKGPKHYSNMHICYQAEKAGRGLADAAPDISALGGVFPPSDPSALQPLKPADLRRPSKPTQDSDFIDIDDLFVSQNSPGKPSVDSWAPDVVNSARPYSPPAQAPTRPQWQEYIHGRDAICRFWHTKGTCSKGYECDWKHTNDVHLPIGPPPRVHSSLNNPSAQPTANQGSPSTQMSRHQLQEQDGYICHFWQMKGSCSKGEECIYKHTNDDNLPTAPAPPGHRCYCKPPDCPPANQYNPPASASAGHNSPTADVSSLQYSPSVATPHATLLTRPPWDKRDPYNAICTWYHKGGCKEGKKCRYLHTDDIRLPIGPNGYITNETCKFWAEGYCQKPASQCLYVHGYPDPTPESLRSKRQPEPLAPSPVVQDEAVNDRHVPQKSVSFATGEPVVFSDELEGSNPPRAVPSKRASTNASFRDPKYDKICIFWIQGDCHHGDTCRYRHTYNESDKQIEQPPASNDTSKDTAFLGMQGVEEDINTRHIHSDRLTRFQAEGTTAVSQTDQTVHSAEPSHQDRPNCVETEGTTSNLQGVRLSTNAQTVEIVRGFQTQADSLNQLQQSGKNLSRLQTQLDVSDTSSPVQTIPETSTPKLRRGSTNISMNSYDRKKVIKALGDRGKEVKFGKDETKFVVVDFGDLSHIKQHPWGLSFAALPKLDFTRSCLAQDFKAQRGSLVRNTLWKGNITAPTDQDQEASNIMERAWEQLRDTSAGLMSVCADFIVLIYPAIKEWKFIEEPATFSSGMRLRYLVFETSVDLSIIFRMPPDAGLTGNAADYRKTLVKSIHALNFKSFVPKLRPEQKYHFYLLFPSTANKMADFMTNWLRANSNQCKIYSSQTEGAWDVFAKDLKGDIGNILIHESAIATVCDLPSLIGLIAPAPPRTVNFWYISEGANAYPMYGPPEGSSPGQISATRLFPHGHAFFLTPSFLIAEPKRACYIIKWFSKEKLNKSTPGTWKLVCAHNIRQYLLEVAIEKSAQKDQLEIDLQGKPNKDAEIMAKGLDYATCVFRFQMHVLMDELLSQQASEHYSDYESYLPDESSSPVIYAHKDIDADDEQALVTWFAGWAMCRLDQFRKFTVVGTGPWNEPEKQPVRKKQVITLRAQPPKLDKSIRPTSPKPKEQSKSDLPKDHERPASPKAGERFKSHPAIPASGPSDFVATSVKLLDSDSTDPSISIETGLARNLDSDRMDIDSPAVEQDAAAQESAQEGKFEATTVWYGRQCKEGNRWEHVYVDSWEKAFKYLQTW